ncbi:hypothetical protein [Nocardia crassostreae]|uniref:hypothetical protein n=1 Tax=Nocardia crassostreae TaxID=53428 RepID=UPI00082BC679|nr:hypothetical protein [Nocardia crassostreae]
MRIQGAGSIAIIVLVGVSIGASACADGDNQTRPAKITAAKPSYPSAPPVATLNADLQMALDPNVPNDQKLDLVQGAAVDPSLPERLTDFYRQKNATLAITKANDLGNGVLGAEAQAAVDGGQPQQVTVPFVVEDGKWKIQKEWICTMLTFSNQTSPACG